MKIFIIISILVLFLTGCGNEKNNNTNEASPQISRTSIQEEQPQTPPTQEAEKEIAKFSTTIFTKNDEARQTNLSITCKKLNEKIVNPGETFSFTNTVGKATPEDGYKKADIFSSDGETIKGYGGGNCQISSTLYNAVLKVSNLKIVERHKHSKKVYYVPER